MIKSILAVLVILVSSVTPACGGSAAMQGGGGSGGGGGGGVGQGGSAGTLLAQGAISLIIQKPTASVNGMSCPDSGSTYNVGAPTPPSSTNPGSSVVDGEHGASVSCSVRGSGPYSFSGSLRGITVDQRMYPVTVSFSSGVVDADRFHGTASVSVFTPVLAGNFSSSQPCTITVIGGQVKPGSIWATFSCPSITSPPSEQCQVGSTSTIVFENCDGS